MKEKHTRLLIRDAIYSTIFVYLCILVFSLNPLNLKVFNLIGSSMKDIEFTDIMFSGKNQGHGEIETKISNDIIVVNAADRGRAEIARLIDKINQEQPAVIGVDFIFEGPKDEFSDSMLAASFNKCKNLVLATKFKNNDGERHNDYIKTASTLGEHTEGFANLMIPSMDKTVRYFRTEDQGNKTLIRPFAFEVVKKYNPSQAEKLIKRHNQFELINYEGNLNNVHHFNGNDIEAGQFPKDFLKGKIVLLGFFGSDCNSNPILDDYFYTPMNEKIMGRKFPDTYGVVIQANIVNMILTEDYIEKTPAWFDWLIGFVICLLHNFIFIRHYVHKHLWYHFYAKIIQFLSAFVLVYLCIYLFKENHIKLHVSPLILPVLLTVDLLYFYDTLLKWMHKKFGTNTYFLTGPAHH